MSKIVPTQPVQSQSVQPAKETAKVDGIKKVAKDFDANTKKVGIENDEKEFDTAAYEHEVISAIEKANKHIRIYDRRLEFSIHDGTKQIMVKVINTEDDSVIREIPSEKILDMVAHLWEMAGILVDEKR